MRVELKVPKKYEKYFGSLEREPDLIDECQYMLYFADGYAWVGEYPCVPVRSKKEALQYLREADREEGYEEKVEQGIVPPVNYNE